MAMFHVNISVQNIPKNSLNNHDLNASEAFLFIKMDFNWLNFFLNQVSQLKVCRSSSGYYHEVTEEFQHSKFEGSLINGIF